MIVDKDKIQAVLVVGAAIFEHMDGTQKAWISMLEDVIVSKGYAPPSFPEFAAIYDKQMVGVVSLGDSTPEQMKTLWWEYYQEQVKEIGGILSGKTL